MKKLIGSLVMITITIAAVATATYAYFSDGKVLGTNNFSTGNVYLDGFNVTGLHVNGLTPGVPVVVPNVGINYIGNMNADLYIGARGTSYPGNTNYIADKLYLRIYYQGTGTVAWGGYVNALSSAWREIADNTAAGWKAYDLQFTLDTNAGYSYQGVNNTDTEILVYAVQHSGPVPSTVPYLTIASDWFKL